MNRTLSILPTALALGALALGSTQTTAFADPDLSGRGKPGQVASDQTPSPKMPPAASLAPPLSGYQLVASALLTAPADAETYGDVLCPSGRATGGGAIVSSSAIGENLNSSWPLADGSGWQVYVHNQTGSDDTFKVYVVCARKIKAYAVVWGPAVNVPPGIQFSGVVTCARGSFPYGGGGVSSSSDLPVLLHGSRPLPKGWLVDVNNGGTGEDTAQAYAICGKKATGYTQVTGTTVPNPANSQTAAVASCPSGTNVFGGGLHSASSETSVNLNSTGWNSSTQWIAWENNTSAVAFSVTPFAVCAAVA
jgi:hypothetical protein